MKIDFNKIISGGDSGVDKSIERSNTAKKYVGKICQMFESENVPVNVGLAACKSIVFYLEKIEGADIQMEIIDQNGVSAKPDEELPKNFGKKAEPSKRSLTIYAILKGRTVVGVDSVEEWASNYEDGHRRVANDVIGEIEISTVFLGLDHSFGEGPPMWFETMIFGGPLNHEMQRYSTYDEAEAGHIVMVKRVKDIS